MFYYSTKVFTEAGLSVERSKEATCGIGAVSIVMTLIVVSGWFFHLVIFIIQTYFCEIIFVIPVVLEMRYWIFENNDSTLVVFYLCCRFLLFADTVFMTSAISSLVTTCKISLLSRFVWKIGVVYFSVKTHIYVIKKNVKCVVNCSACFNSDQTSWGTWSPSALTDWKWGNGCVLWRHDHGVLPAGNK